MPKKKTTEQFIEEAKEVHGNNYIYDEVTYNGRKKEVYIICPKHGGFWQRPDKHLIGHGCPECAQESRNKIRTIPLFKRLEFIKESCLRKNLSFLGFCNRNGEPCEYDNYTTHLRLKCNVCGHEWTSTNYDNFLHKDTKCVRCQANKRNDFNAHSAEDAIKSINRRLNKDVSFLYFCDTDGKSIEYVRGKNIRIKLKCNKCQQEWITTFFTPNQSCPLCYGFKLEHQIMSFLEENKIHYNLHKHFPWLSKLSVDFFLPQYNTAIECQGKQHFSVVEWFGGEKEFKKIIERDERKRKLCEENGIKLLYYSNLGIDYPYKVYEDKEELLKEIIKMKND